MSDCQRGVAWATSTIVACKHLKVLFHLQLGVAAAVHQEHHTHKYSPVTLGSTSSYFIVLCLRPPCTCRHHSRTPSVVSSSAPLAGKASGAGAAAASKGQQQHQQAGAKEDHSPRIGTGNTAGPHIPGAIPGVSSADTQKCPCACLLVSVAAVVVCQQDSRSAPTLDHNVQRHLVCMSL